MAPKDYISARENVGKEESYSVLIDGQPYYPHLKVDGNDESSIRRAVATRFQVNGESKDWSVSQVSGGITNLLYSVDTKEHKLLVRIFGAEGMIDRDVETATFAALAAQGLAPRYFGRFANGRLEEFLPGMKPLSPRQMAEPVISQSIARQLAKMHAQFKVPEELTPYHSSSGEPNMWTQLEDWMTQASQAIFQTEEDTQRAALLRLNQIPQELKWLREEVVPKDAPLAFCHNDLLAANILYMAETGSIRLIDFEYGGINYKAFDIANHFNEYAGGTDDGVTNYDWFPSQQHQITFLKTYLEASSGAPPSDSTVQQWYDQVQPFVLANHLYWGLWAVNQAATEGCQDFDYLLFATNRIARYFECKQKDFSNDA